ncbi:phosphohexomutase domain-containing protein [Natronorarus salvus]|uniref:phosphomannomutase n=1 Tax=Natronorarus salvus TaxID=3117733 RepID=UPI002F265903
MDLFGTAGIRGDTRTRVTPELALSVGRAAGLDGDEFVVGRDGRETGGALAAALEAGLTSAGASVRRLGVVPTPAVAFAARDCRGAMLTASHNPPTDNGIKLFSEGVEYDREAERRIESRVAKGVDAESWDRWGTVEEWDVLPRYREAVAAYAEGLGSEPVGLRVAVDCGNGVAGLATPQVLRELGASVVTLNAQVDGHFPGRPSKPTEETLSDLGALVANTGTELGIGHDGDADRIVILDSHGRIVHEDTVLAILAEHYTRHATAADPVVVTTPNASARIDERVETAGGRTERVRLGALHEGIARVYEGGGEETEVVFAAEPWKHIHTAFGGWIDGVASAAVLVRLVADAGGLGALREPITERPYRKVAVACPDERKEAVMESLEGSLPDTFPEASVDTDYGVRLEWPDAAWILVRPSGTEPYVRLYAESEDVDALIADARAAIEREVGE